MHLGALVAIVLSWRVVSTEEARVLGDVCPPESSTAAHSIPPVVYYTGLYDIHLQNLTLNGGRWPANYAFRYYDDAGLDATMVAFGGLLAAEGVGGAYEAFQTLRPGAYKADLWRYCMIWACGGIYVDSKMRVALDFGQFLDRAHAEMKRAPRVGPKEEAGHLGGRPTLITCIDRWVTKLDRFQNVTGIWQGLLVGTRRHPDLLKVIREVISNVERRIYPHDEGKLEMLYITGPGTFARATQDDPTWPDRISLPCHWGNHGPELRTIWGPGSLLLMQDSDLHNSLRGGEHKSYGEMYKRHEVYEGDVPIDPLTGEPLATRDA